MKRKSRRRKPANQNKKNKTKYSVRKKYFLGFGLFCVIFISIAIYFRSSIRFYYAMYFNGHTKIALINTPRETKRISKIIKEYNDKTFGIDISHYQRIRDIKWDSLSIANGAISIDFVVLRASMGINGKDKNFNYFWKKAKEHNKIRGAYHFYKPNQNPVEQANNFLSRVKLESGDLPPILDIERIPNGKTKQELVRDLKIWCDIMEEKYSRKPIIYTYYHYYKDYLREDFSGYVLWLANYNDVLVPSKEDDWQFWQFTEKGIVHGIDTKVDLDIYDGSLWSLKNLTIY